ncbi:extracellular phospholipase C, partial [Metarhizium majus ARSEF 297]
MALVAGLPGVAKSDSLKDVEHVVLFMQENRAFDHYFGTMAGVRGFNDANLQMNDGVPVWKQKTSPELTNSTDYIMPWYLNYLGGNWSEATQCMIAGSNGWYQNHAAWNGGTNDHWALNNTPYSIGYYKREDLPTQWALAENWVVGDMYQESVIASTSPNRVMWISGSINVPGGNLSPDLGGNPYIDNYETPGCDDNGINCYPLKWKTAPEYWEEAGVSWQIYQDGTDDYDNFDDNPLAWFEQFQQAKQGSNLNTKGMQGRKLQEFYDRAANGTLPEVSIIVGYRELAEHPPYSPHDGAWLENKIAETVIKSPKYNRTILIFSFDETGGWFDHVDPYRSPNGTAGEWYNDKAGIGYTFTGPGFRVPFYIISPWTRKGGVFVEHADHTSQLQFIENWQAAKSRSIKTHEMVPWRRENMADLLSAFDFSNPDYSIPELPKVPEPHRNSRGKFDGASHCMGLYGDPRPPVPYSGDGATTDMAGLVEHGFKPIRGKLTEGRYLVLEMGRYALASAEKVVTGKACKRHDSKSQRWVVHVEELGGTRFKVSSGESGKYVCADLALCSDKCKAIVFDVRFKPGRGYSFEVKDGEYLVADDRGELSLNGSRAYWTIYSVSY